MNSETTTSNCNSLRSNYSSANSVISKIRRLKIQEGLFLQYINKLTSELHYNDGNNTSSSISEYKHFISDLSCSFSEIRNLFDAVKHNTSCQETLENSDINDIKKDVTELDIKIKQFKTILGSKLQTLLTNEQDLLKDVNTISDQAGKIRKLSKIEPKPYMDIIPSPVKNVINSPFKCPEVQQFQEFMIRSQNRYGGWLEYNHNIFVQCWRKHFQSRDDMRLEDNTVYIQDNSLFFKDILEKISGITRRDIIEHIDWYSKYLHYKTRQQEALDKWRAKKHIIKKSQRTNSQSLKYDEIDIKKLGSHQRSNEMSGRRYKGFQNVDEIMTIRKKYQCDSFDHTTQSSQQQIINIAAEGEPNSCDHRVLKKLEKINFKAENNKRAFGFTKSTEQWNNKCQNGKHHTQDTFLHIEDIEKLCVPRWRKSLQDF